MENGPDYLIKEARKAQGVSGLLQGPGMGQGESGSLFENPKNDVRTDVAV